MAEYIEKAAAIQNVIWAKENHMDEVEALECTITADVAPVVHGRWVCIGNKPHLIYGCSECGDQWGYGSMLHMKYCPNCGARMDGDTHET